MSVIVWDGRTLAADKRTSNGSAVATCTKIRKVSLNGESYLIGWTGDEDAGHFLAQWFERGCDDDKWPESQKDKEAWARLIVVSRNGVFTYERFNVRIPCDEPKMAWGSGRDFARAALHLGEDAASAVMVACAFDSACGNGVDWLAL